VISTAGKQIAFKATTRDKTEEIGNGSRAILVACRSQKAFAIAVSLTKLVELIFTKINPNLEDACAKRTQYWIVGHNRPMT
jgi:hypothetical protein